MKQTKNTGHLAILMMLSMAVGLAQDHQHTMTKAGEVADHLEHHFDATESAKNFDDPARDAWQMPDKVIAVLKLKAGQAVADIGAGTGYFTVRLAKANTKVHVYGVDVEPSMTSYIKARADKDGLTNVTAVQATADSPNLPVAMDTILIVDTFHHIPNRVPYFRKLATSLKPGGRLAIIDFKPESPTGPPKEFRFAASKIAGELAKAGFRQTEKHDFLPNQHFLVFTAN